MTDRIVPRWSGLLCALLLLLAPVTASRAEDAGARAPVDALHEALLRAMREADALGFRGRYALLDPVVARVYDVEFMASKSLGRHWKKLDPEQRSRWIALFRKLTVSTYADRFDGWSGESFELTSVEPSARGTSLVHTRIQRSEGSPVELDYRVRPRAKGEHRIIDVYLNGTVSELALRRSDYSSLLKREGYDALLQAVGRKIAEAEAGTPDEGSP